MALLGNLIPSVEVREDGNLRLLRRPPAINMVRVMDTTLRSVHFTCIEMNSSRHLLSVSDESADLASLAANNS
jgi:hypothetical protein